MSLTVISIALIITGYGNIYRQRTDGKDTSYIGDSVVALYRSTARSDGIGAYILTSSTGYIY